MTEITYSHVHSELIVWLFDPLVTHYGLVISAGVSVESDRLLRQTDNHIGAGIRFGRVVHFCNAETKIFTDKKNSAKN